MLGRTSSWWMTLLVGSLVACGSNEETRTAVTSGAGAQGGAGGGSTTSAGGGGALPGNAWYVSRSGDNSDGKSWATAWNELDQIDWTAPEAGDRIEVEGGTYTTRLDPTAGGDQSGHITLERSTDRGHDGKVTFDFSSTEVPEYWAGQIAIHQPYLTIDGKDWSQFEMIGGASCLLVVDNGTDDDFFELRNVRLEGPADVDNGGAALCIFSGSVALDHAWFGQQVGAEDHIKLVTESHSSLTVEHCVFSPWVAINGSHSDLIEQCWPGCDAGDLVFKRNLVWDSGPGGENLVFTLDPHWASVDVSYNVFLDTSGVFQFTSQGAQRISNNVFYNVGGTFGGDARWEAVNNIFMAPPSNTNIVWGTIPRYSLWGPGTYGYFDGGGTNLQADPLFVDPQSILGADGVPFTDDDGFALQAGSPAIDAGMATVDATDIRGTAIAGTNDIGAYEHP
jgi:hypothetical protein